MKIGIIIPVWLQVAGMLDLTREAVARVQTKYSARVYIACNRLHICEPGELEATLTAATAIPLTVLHEPNVERSVAGAWNWGARRAIRDGADLLLILANDCLVEPECIDHLVAFGTNPNNEGIAVWSGVDTRNRTVIDPVAVTDGCDFTCAMLRPTTLERHGSFDERYRPAYFEDNDYYVRVILGGKHCRVVHAARFFHHGSMTTRLDPEAAHHVRHWFGINRSRFEAKWGVSQPPRNEAEVIALCHKSPWGDPTLPLSHWDHG